jgi:pterin-4a-carbinolamine dehydratase
MPQKKPLAFVSYRRSDSSAASRWLATSIARTFGPQSVFTDTESIRMSDDWPDRIDQALAAATLLLPVIGPDWLRTADEDGRRRIDQEDDWVANEIRHALDSQVLVLPILISRTPMPKKTALPAALAALASKQAFELRDERWETDLGSLLDKMEELGFSRTSAEVIRYPHPALTLRELSEADLAEGLRQLPWWHPSVTDLPGQRGRQRFEIYRPYEFDSFEDAIAFMCAATPEITRRQHHPRWQNLWRTVSVWLSTWDIGHKPSRLDIELALYLDELYKTFQAQNAAK